MHNRISALHILILISFAFFAAATASAEMLLMEDFDDGIANGFTPTDSNWQVEGGYYRCDLTGIDVFSLAMVGDDTWDNYVVECDVRVEGSLNNVLAFRVRDECNFYDINICADPFNHVILTKRVNDSDTWHSVVSYDNVVGSWHHIQVSMVGNRISIDIDGNHLIDLVDSLDPYLSGGIATVGYCGVNIHEQTAWFDNVVVYTSDVIATDRASWDGVKALYR